MIYYMSRHVEVSFEDAVRAIEEKLRQEGLTPLTDIDAGRIFSEKMGLEFRQYRIFGVCDPLLAYEALQAESKIGTLLPCNIIVQEMEDGRTEVASVDPIASMIAVKNPEIQRIAKQMQDKLKKVVESI